MQIDPAAARSMQSAVRRSPWLLLLSTLLELTEGKGELVRHAERSWASATFSGTRHNVVLSFTGADAVSAGENSGNVPVMLDKSAMILQTEVESRMDAVTKLIEPLVLSVLGVIVAVFVLGCLLPIVELTSTL